ncbi:MAG: CotH kinase family protein [Bacteroidetes bacterium]|nr:CotH kinase family protein [Bacteroidota bacterium]
MLNKIKSFFSILVITSVLSCQENIVVEGIDGTTILFCDAEDYDNAEKKFTTNHVLFDGGIQTDKHSFDGTYSCELNQSNLYGMGLVFDDVQPGEVIKASVYRKSSGKNGSIVISSKNNELYYANKVSYTKNNESGWEKINLTIKLPQDITKLGGIKIYVYYGGEKLDPVYFDNFEVIRYVENSSFQKDKNNNGIKIELSSQDYQELARYRDFAVKNKVLDNNSKKEFDGVLKYKDKSYKIGIRLKGDWTDHLTSNKWSYRIKIKEENAAFMGLKSFSIQSPLIRDFLHEWVAHEICKKEDLLTTRMEYVPVSINGVYLGVYNLEEHFEKQLLESKNRREGPILKFSEEGFWECNLYHQKNNIYPARPYFYASTISPFKEKKTLKTEKLKHQFLIAQNLMYKYKTGEEDSQNYLDIKRMAKNYALMDIFNVIHANNWHNQRFYYNPVISRLEPIVYDCYTGLGSFDLHEAKIRGNETSGNHKIESLEWYLYLNLFDNPDFLSYYIDYLTLYSSEKYINTTLKELTPKIDSLSQLLQTDFEGYFYNKNSLINTTKIIRKELQSYKQKANTIHYNLSESINSNCEVNNVFKNISLNVHLQKQNENGSVLLSLNNFHCSPIKVIGYASKINKDSIIRINSEIILPAFSKNQPDKEVTIPVKTSKLYFKVLKDSSETIYSSKIISWPRPTTNISSSKLFEGTLTNNSPFYKIKDKQITFVKGKHIVKTNIVIPKGYTVTFESGVELVLNNSIGFLSYSPIHMNGTKEAPIKITSTDGTGKGFTVLHPSSPSRLNYVIFEGLNTFDYFGWTLTGSVTFYEANVLLKNCIINNNKCEDALNIIQSNFEVYNCSITNTFGDGFDADFCKGKVVDTKFMNTGNDGMDFSGSFIEINNCNVKNAGDKGISCGEGSTVLINNTNINTANIGIASKDRSSVKINNIKIENCKLGFSLFQKKPEYGSATIDVKNYYLNKIDTTSFVESGSSITFENKLLN